MSKRNWFIGSLAILIFLILGIYFFFPAYDSDTAGKERELKVSFLEVNPRWADSLLKEMTLAEKTAMLLMVRADDGKRMDSLYASGFKPGAWVVNTAQILSNEKRTFPDRSLLFTDYTQLPVIQSKKIKLPETADNSIFGNEEIFFSVTSDSLLKESLPLFRSATDYHHIDGIFLPQIVLKKKIGNRIYRKDTLIYHSRIRMLQKILSGEQVLSSAAILHTFESGEKNPGYDSVFTSIKSIYAKALPVIVLDSLLKVENEKNAVSVWLEKKLKFKGICLSVLSRKNSVNSDHLLLQLNAGVDMFRTDNPEATSLTLQSLVTTGRIKENRIDARVKKILLAKTWCNLRRKKVNYEEKKSFTAYEKSFPRRFRKAAFNLLKNDKNYLPVRNVASRIGVIHIGKLNGNFTSQLYHYLPPKLTVASKTYGTATDAAKMNPGDYKRYGYVVVTIHDDISQNKIIREKLLQLASVSKLIVLNFTFPQNLESLLDFSTVVQLWGNSVIETEFSAQAIYGAVGFYARFPISFKTDGRFLKEKKLAQSRLQYTIPEDIGIAADSLAKIDYIVEEGIRNKAFPGAQVFFAIDGKVFYNRSFGTHTYSDRQEVKTSDLFDMASVTKVAASTIVAMSAYERGFFRLNDSLYKHLPDTLKKHLHGQSSLRNITFKQILTHETGLAAGQPILRYLRYRDSVEGRFDKYYCDEPDKYYCVQVADKFYMEKEQLDTIWYAMNRMPVDENPDYRYSDANMNLLYKLLDAKIKNRWRHYLDSLFYKPAGMFRTFYLPLECEIEPENIVPTENDRYWRKQLLRGYVHDPTAALFGGVAGNAGLFSTAEDIGILFQMLLFGGNYGGNTFFKRETVDLFVSQQPGSHRGLGFNRQVKGSTYGCSPFASENTFGHTGFTGISVWADQDIKLIYVSCTNRVHPDPENKKIINLGTTKRIHNVVYEQLEYLIPDKIDLGY